MAAIKERLAFGGPTVSIKQVVSVDPPNLAAQTGAYLDVAVTDCPAELVGACSVLATPSGDLGAGYTLGEARLSAANTVRLAFSNATAGAINPAAQNMLIEVRPLNPLP